MRPLKFIPYNSADKIDLFSEEYFIKVNISSKTKLKYHKTGSIIGRLHKVAEDKSRTANIRSFFNFLLHGSGSINKKGNKPYSFLREIILCKPEDFTKMDEKICKELAKLTLDIKKVKDDLLEAFNYERIRDNHGTWIVETLNLKACPYCGSQYLITYKDEYGKKRFLGDLDHFYPKDKYPYFSASFFNLIPSCKPCNHKKREEDTTIEDFPHPYKDDLDSLFSFGTEPASVASFLSNPNKDIKINTTIPTELDKKERQKIENHIRRFEIEKIYEQHQDVAEELYWKAQVYNEDKKNELINLLEGLSFEEKDIKRFIIGNYVEKDDALKRPLVKFYKDISKELNLI